MNTDKRSAIHTRDLLISLGKGALIACITLVPYSVSEWQTPVYLAIPLAVISFFSMPGLILTTYILRSPHDPNLPLAGVINTLIYGGIALWLSVRKRRKWHSTNQGHLD